MAAIFYLYDMEQSTYTKYKIVHDTAEHSYILYEFDKPVSGRIILIFEAQTYEEAAFIKNQFLHFEPYRPFDDFWIATVGHFVYVDDKLLEDGNYEIRTLIVLAKSAAIAKAKILEEVKNYSQPYKNAIGGCAKWEFDQKLSLEIMDFFNTIELYQGKVVEVKSKRITKK